VDREGVAWASLGERELVNKVEQVSSDSKMDGLKLETWFESSHQGHVGRYLGMADRTFPISRTPILLGEPKALPYRRHVGIADGALLLKSLLKTVNNVMFGGWHN
jgi:hypothetical protein